MLIKQHTSGGLEKHLPPVHSRAGSAQTLPNHGQSPYPCSCGVLQGTAAGLLSLPR